MAITLVESGYAISSGTVDSVSVTLAAEAEVGDVIVAIGLASSRVLTEVAMSGGGGTYTLQSNLEHTSELRELYLWTTVIAEEATTFTWSTQSTSTLRRLVIYRLTGVDTTTPTTGTVGTAETTGTSHAASTTPAVADALLIGASLGSTGVYTLDATFTAATGFTATTVAASGSKAVTTAQAYTMTNTTSASENVISVLIALAPYLPTTSELICTVAEQQGA